MKRLIVLLVSAVMTAAGIHAQEQKPVIYMIGDSTMADKNLEGGSPERGWGQMLPGFLSEDIAVSNHAKNGRSTKSFIDEGLWDNVVSRIRPGDYVFIQFGHNDEKPDPARHTDAGGSFDDNLRKFVIESRSKGGIPVLFNSIVRRKFGDPDDTQGISDAISHDDHYYRENAEIVSVKQSGSKLADTHGAYIESPRRIAEELDVPFVDMNRITHDLVEGMGPERSKEIFLWIPPKTVASHPAGKEDDTHLNIRGARLITGLTIDAIAEAVPGLAPYVRHYDIVVAKDGSGDFFSVQEAVNAVPDYRKNKRTTILVRKGIYKEKLVIPESKINISLYGHDGAVISNDDYADRLGRFGDKLSTSGSSTCYIYAPDFYAENITFENTAGPVGQAVACFVSADRAFFRGCRFLGYQDTLYTYAEGCRQYYKDCYIEGTVDFIFGWSAAVFDNCLIHSLADGYVTAPSTPENQKYGYVFHKCTLTAEEGVEKVYLSRPWRPYAKAVFIECSLDSHIVPEGWHNWNRKDAEKTVFYAEYRSTGDGASPKTRAGFSRQLKSAEGFAMEDVLKGDDGWNPILNGNSLLNIKR